MKKIFIALLLSSLAAVCLPAAESKPSILFCSPQGVTGGWIDLQYLRELHDKGFEVDYTQELSISEITWNRIKNYNVLVLYATPDGFDVAYKLGESSSKMKISRFAGLIERFVEAGGGVFLIPWEMNVKKQMLSDLTSRWGAKLPVEMIVESDPSKLATLDHASYPVPIAFTDQVLPSPVSEGVKQIWYPINPAYNAAHGGPIEVDQPPPPGGAGWQIVVKASQTAMTKPVDLSKTGCAPTEDVLQRAEGVKAPPLFAIRSFKAGRIALVNQWPQYSIGSGVKWIYDRQILSKGVGNKPSDFGRLIENAFRWLAEPSLQNKAVGGYVTKEETLIAPNRREEARKQFDYTFHYYEDEVMQWHRPPKYAPLFRGIIGAKTAYSSGQGAVKDFAEAAKKVGVQFIVFLEDFDKLTPEKFAQLKEDCKKYSDDRVTLLGGFTIDANTGDRMFLFGPDGKWPPPNVRTGPNKTLYDLQPQDKDGRFTGYNGDSFNWLFEYHDVHGNVGYYNFKANSKGMKISDLRCYGMAALRYYKEGKLLEDRTADYLTCAQGTIPPAPVSFNDVRSPEELMREARSGNALTYVQARSITNIFPDGLWWPNQYTSYNTFPSDGPLIHDWPHTVRVMTLGSEEFVTMAAIMPSTLAVSADRGLKEIAIYNGRELFRRFLFNGEKEVCTTLILNGTVQRNLVVVATDLKGGQAVSFARRAWKEGGRQPVFCSDHVNDCKSGGMLLAHGPNPMIVHWVVPLPDDIAGATWDGGPPASLPLVRFQESRPALVTDKGEETGTRFNQTPLLEFSDEGAVAVASLQNELFDSSLQAVVNPWHTFGPIAGPSKLFEATLRYREYHTPTVGVPEAGWAGPGIREGINACLFRSEIKFKQDFTIKQLTLLQNSLAPKVAPVFFAHGHLPAAAAQAGAPAAVAKVINLSEGEKGETIRLAPGDWFALFSGKISSSHVFIVREQPVVLFLHSSGSLVVRADIEGKPVKQGDAYAFELFSLGIPLDVKVPEVGDVARRLAYLNEPEGMKLLRGKRVASPGFIECLPADGAVEIVVPKPKPKTDLTLPLRVAGLNPRWTAGLLQKKGYVKGDYGTGLPAEASAKAGENRFRELGMDAFGCAYVPMYVDKADETHLVAGHPVVADEKGRELFIQVTHVFENPHQWHVSVNNPTDATIKTILRKAMDLPGFIFHNTEITLKPGEYKVMM
ncbi:MAG: hypothetical protein HY360_10580 [Verrucomicrobia bacterium]|nr:hypothetical protein [Verrucomicrobiota bacterium]